MNRKIILPIIGLLTYATANAQQTPVDYDRLAANCQLVVEANIVKNAKQAELDKLTSKLESLKQQWRDICYSVLDDPNSTTDDFQILLNSTYPEIDGKDLWAALNNAMAGGEVKRPQSTPAVRQTSKPKVEEPVKPKEEKPVKESPKKETKPGKEAKAKGSTDPDTAVVDPTKKGNTPEKVATPEKKQEEKKEQGDDEIVESKFKKNRNNKE